MGDVTALLDTQGNVVVKYAYDAWGKVLSVTDGSGNAITDEYHVGNQNPFRYRGYYYDTETGFYYLQSRYYDPETGRFLNADGVLGANGDLTSYNMFAYCSNMPTVAVDPTGYGLFFDHDGKMVYGDRTTGNSGYYLDGSGRSFGYNNTYTSHQNSNTAETSHEAALPPPQNFPEKYATSYDRTSSNLSNTAPSKGTPAAFYTLFVSVTSATKSISTVYKVKSTIEGLIAGYSGLAAIGLGVPTFGLGTAFFGTLATIAGAASAVDGAIASGMDFIFNKGD